MKYRTIKTIIIAAIMVSVFSATAVSAAILVDIPDIGCPLGGPCPTAAQLEKGDIAGNIVRIYQFAVAIAGILAVGTIVAGSIYISVSGGSPDKQSEGKDMITSAIWGLVLLFGSYLILNTVNPRLTALETPTLLEPCIYDASLKITNKPCNPIPKAYSFKDLPIPGETPAKSVGAEALRQALQSNDPQVLARMQYCISLDTNATKSDPMGCAKEGNCSTQIEACILRPQCSGCTPLDSGLRMRLMQCRWLSEPSNCIVNPKTNSALLQLAIKLKNEDILYEITEAFPPTVTHMSDSHYNGCAVDIIVWGKVKVEMAKKCEVVATAIKAAESVGFRKFGDGSANEYVECGGEQYRTSTGGHLHLSTVGCP